MVSGLSGVTQVSAGAFHSVALKSDGTVRAWGLNASGQLVDGTTTTRTQLVTVSGLSGVVAVGAGRDHSLAAKSGSVWAWGRNDFGQLGDGTLTNRSSPVKTADLAGVIELEGGGATASPSWALSVDPTPTGCVPLRAPPE